ncbi:hypothetical protein scyTo_0000178 [Scyliorhinus torazame]|uniref:Uncharacterized protein n=1 Tax=Scyliorhinus torazame TaxID=75743 RepID=A0A401NS26_SCYTO|nr:hypothetical protein [Scyliorhinus torazame]
MSWKIKISWLLCMKSMRCTLAEFQPITGEIEVTSTALKGSTPLMVRRSSDPALIPPALFQPGASQSDEPLNRNLTVKPIIVVNAEREILGGNFPNETKWHDVVGVGMRRVSHCNG